MNENEGSGLQLACCAPGLTTPGSACRKVRGWHGGGNAPARYLPANLYENAQNLNKIRPIQQRTGRRGPKTENDSAVLQRKPLGTICGCFICSDLISITQCGATTCLNRAKMPRYKENMRYLDDKHLSRPTATIDRKSSLFRNSGIGHFSQCWMRAMPSYGKMRIFWIGDM